MFAVDLMEYRSFSIIHIGVRSATMFDRISETFSVQMGDVSVANDEQLWQFIEDCSQCD